VALLPGVVLLPFEHWEQNGLCLALRELGFALHVGQRRERWPLLWHLKLATVQVVIEMIHLLLLEYGPLVDNPLRHVHVLDVDPQSFLLSAVVG